MLSASAILVLLLALVSLKRSEALPQHESLSTTSRQDAGNFFDRPGGPTLLSRAAALHREIESSGCPIDVCFALDGSHSLSPQDYEFQKEFTQLVALVLGADTRSRFTAVQYGLPAIAISNFTSNASEFVVRVSASRFASAPRTFISSGLLFCTVSLGREDVNPDKIVLLGDGMANIGADPIMFSDTFLPPKGQGSILAVGVGNINITSLTRLAGPGDAFLSINDQRNLPSVLEATVRFLCRI